MQVSLSMARPLLPDGHWREIAPLLPPPRPRPTGGRGPIKDRAALIGILLVLRSGLPWEMRPAEMGGCGMSWGGRQRDLARVDFSAITAPMHSNKTSVPSASALGLCPR